MRKAIKFELVPAALAFAFGLMCCPCLSAQVDNPEVQFKAAVAAQERGDQATALRIYRGLVLRHPGTLVVRVNLGGLLVEMGRFDEAIEQYRAAAGLAPTSRDIQLGLAYAYESKGDAISLKRAVESLESLHRSDPADGQAAMLLGDGYSRQGRYAEAVKVLAPLESIHPDDNDLEWLLGGALVRTGHVEDGVLRIDKVAARTGAADAYLLAGETRLGMSQYDLARSNAETALKKTPELPGGQTLLGMVLEQTGDYDGAEVALRKAIQANAEDFNAQFYLGALLYFKRDLAGAGEHLEQALRLQPSSAEARYKQALVEQTKGNKEAAVKNLEIVIRQRPDWLEPHVKLAALYYGLHRTQEAAKERGVVDRLSAAQQRGPSPTP